MPNVPTPATTDTPSAVKDRARLKQLRYDLANEKKPPKTKHVEAAVKAVTELLRQIGYQSSTVREIIQQAEVSDIIRDDETRRATKLLALHHSVADLFAQYFYTDDVGAYHLSTSTARALAHQMMGTDELAYALRLATYEASRTS